MTAVVVIWRIGMAMIRALGQTNEPPPPGEMRRVNLRYRCSICAAEVKMTQAAENLPPPPRHCQEDMELVAGPFD